MIRFRKSIEEALKQGYITEEEAEAEQERQDYLDIVNTRY